MENHTFLIFETKYLSLVNFEEVLQTSENTVRKSIDELKTFIKWDSTNIPSSVEAIPEPKQYVNYNDIVEILNTEEWILKF